MKKIIKGICPISKTECTVSANYLDASTLDKKNFVRTYIECEIRGNGLECSLEDCPLVKLFPSNING